MMPPKMRAGVLRIPKSSECYGITRESESKTESENRGGTLQG